MKKLLSAATALALTALAAPTQAAVFTESFDGPPDEPLVAWKSGWFGQNSNAAINDPFALRRDNNVTGLTIFDGNRDDGRSVNIFFTEPFASSLLSFSFDVLNYATGVDQILRVFDVDGATLLSTTLAVLTTGPSGPFDFPDSAYVRYSVTSTNGIGGFTILPFGAEGNVSIDDLVAVTAEEVPEPGSLGLMLGGMALVGFGIRRSRMRAAA